MGEPRRSGVNICFEDWSMPDPEYEPLADALHTARYALGSLTQEQAYLILGCAEAYLHLVTHPAGTESVVKQLREVRRALREIPPWVRPTPDSTTPE